jgi:hypothetical protein
MRKTSVTFFSGESDDAIPLEDFTNRQKILKQEISEIRASRAEVNENRMRNERERARLLKFDYVDLEAFLGLFACFMRGSKQENLIQEKDLQLKQKERDLRAFERHIETLPASEQSCALQLRF